MLSVCLWITMIMLDSWVNRAVWLNLKVHWLLHWLPEEFHFSTMEVSKGSTEVRIPTTVSPSGTIWTKTTKFTSSSKLWILPENHLILKTNHSWSDLLLIISMGWVVGIYLLHWRIRKVGRCMLVLITTLIVMMNLFVIFTILPIAFKLLMEFYLFIWIMAK